MDFDNTIAAWGQRVDEQLRDLLQQAQYAPRLQQAMQYSSFNGGKRLRPVLVYAACQALSGELANADRAAAAVEMIHAYSLIHDDLPAMDDDDLRRGKPTCHIAYDEATAILAGDALQALAFETLACGPASLSADTKLAMLACLAAASGDKGMVAGQVIDIESSGANISLDALAQMHRLKTGALIKASVRLGGLASGKASTEQLQALENYADALGLAFQVQDDILDVVGDTATLGKQQGADIALSKSTYPALLGLQAAKDKAAELHQQALAALSVFDHNADLLRHLADFVIARNH